MFLLYAPVQRINMLCCTSKHNERKNNRTRLRHQTFTPSRSQKTDKKQSYSLENNDVFGFFVFFLQHNQTLHLVFNRTTAVNSSLSGLRSSVWNCWAFHRYKNGSIFSCHIKASYFTGKIDELVYKSISNVLGIFFYKLYWPTYDSVCWAYHYCVHPWLCLYNVCTTLVLYMHNKRPLFTSPFLIFFWKLTASTEAVTMLVLQWRAATMPATSSISFMVTPASDEKEKLWLY